MREQKMHEQTKKKEEKIKAGILIPVAAAVLFVYLGMAFYFHSHFFPGTVLDGLKTGGYTAQKVMDEITEEIHSYHLNIVTREGKTETISGKEISLEPEWGDEIKQMIEAQPVFAWPVKIFQKKIVTGQTIVKFNEKQLEGKINGLVCMDKESQTAPVDASIADYDSVNGFAVKPCIMGTAIDADKMKQAVTEAVNSLRETLDLDKEGVYADTEIRDDNDKLLDAVKTMNEYAKTVITFTVGKESQTLDASVFGKWFSLNDKVQPVLDRSKVTEYVEGLAKKYNTCYSAKTLKTSYGKTVTIPESHYGWKVDTDKEVEEIIKEIKSGKPVTRDLNYSMTANSHEGNDYGNSYVEINLTAQHLFLYKDGKLVIESDFVSGNLARNFGSPTGAYGITYTKKDAVLRGDNYETPVSYWMPFAGNVGMHDATWRSSFGGSIYKYSGSHGCINLPLDAAKVIFENVKKNYPVLVYELPGTESVSEADKKKEEDKKQAEAVTKLIDAIGEVTKDSKDAIDSARTSYDKLSADGKQNVKNYKKLQEAEAAYKKLTEKSKKESKDKKEKKKDNQKNNEE